MKWPEPLTYYYSTRGYPENCVGAANKMLASCKKAFEEAQGQWLVPLDEISIIIGEWYGDKEASPMLMKAIKEKLGTPKATLDFKIICSCGDEIKPKEYDPDVPGLHFYCIGCDHSIWVDAGYAPKAGVESKDLHKQDKRVLGDRLCKLMGWGNKGWDIQNKALKRQMIYELICRIETTPSKGEI